MDLFLLGGLRDNRVNQLYDNKLRHTLATVMTMLVAFGMSCPITNRLHGRNLRFSNHLLNLQCKLLDGLIQYNEAKKIFEAGSIDVFARIVAAVVIYKARTKFTKLNR